MNRNHFMTMSAVCAGCNGMLVVTPRTASAASRDSAVMLDPEQIKAVTLLLSGVNVDTLQLYGLEQRTRKPLILQAGVGTYINGKWGHLSTLRRGDLIDARLVMDANGQLITRSIEANLWEGVTRVTHVGSVLSVVQVDRQTLEPSAIVSADDVAPTHAVASTSSIRFSGVANGYGEIRTGHYARIYARKRPDSPVLNPFIIETFDRQVQRA